MCKTIFVHKVGEYYEEKDNNNTLPMELNDVRSISILDSRVGITLTTKNVWEA